MMDGDDGEHPEEIIYLISEGLYPTMSESSECLTRHFTPLEVV